MRWTSAALALVLAVVVAAGAQAAAADDFTATPSTVRAGSAVTFTATFSTAGPPVTAWGWDFGDGSGASGGQQVSHTYTTPGTRTATLSVTRRKGDPTTVSHAVTVLALPRATFTRAPADPDVGEIVRFDASGSSDVARGGLDYRWDFGDGTTGTGTTPEHAYATPGDKTVTLTATSEADGATGTTAQTVHVNAPPVNAPPQVSLSVALADPNAGQDPLTPIVGQSVVLSAENASDPDGSIVSYAWDLGSGFGAAGPNTWLMTSFSSPGARTVRVRATDDHGATTIASADLRVDAPPRAAFDVAPAAPRTGDRVVFTSSATDPDGLGDIAAIAWDLDGDGTFTDDAGPLADAVFLSPGQYTVAQRVTDRAGATATVSRTVSVIGPPAPNPGLQDVTAVGAPQTATSTGQRRAEKKVLRGVGLRIAGSVVGGRTTLTAVALRLPKGAHAVVRCAGGGCPAKARIRVQALRTGMIALPQLRRTYRAGAHITVLATKSGYMPKRIRVTFRRGRPPLRAEDCLIPGTRQGQTRARPCPAA